MGDYSVLLIHCFRVIYDQFSAQDAKGKLNGTGLQLLGVVLANKLPPYAPGCGVKKEEYVVFVHFPMSFQLPHLSFSL